MERWKKIIGVTKLLVDVMRLFRDKFEVYETAAGGGGMVKLVSDDADRKESLRARLRPIAEIFVQAIRDRGERRDTVIPIRALLDIMAKSDKYDLDDINETLRMVENLWKDWRIFKWKFFQLYPDLFRLSDYKEGVGWSVSLVAPRRRITGKRLSLIHI